MLQKALKYVVDRTYNMISVDGDTSTNDTLTIMTNCKAGNPEITEENEDYEAFLNGLYVVLQHFSKVLAADGEGATKLIECVEMCIRDSHTIHQRYLLHSLLQLSQ